MKRNLLAILMAGQFRWIEFCSDNLVDDLDILVADDATPRIEEFCATRGLNFVTKPKANGGCDSWNLIYRYFLEHDYDKCIISHDDVFFPPGFSDGLFAALDAGYDLVCPVTNEPGHKPQQRYENFTDKLGFRSVMADLKTKHSGKDDFREKNVRGVNGFCFAFGRSIQKYAFNEDTLVDTSFCNCGCDDAISRSVEENGGKMCICLTSYVHHFRSGTRILTGHRHNLWTESTKLDEPVLKLGPHRELLKKKHER